LTPLHCALSPTTLAQGAAVTSGLRKVTDDMKTKNRADRSGAVVAAPKAAAPSHVQGQTKPRGLPSTVLQQRRWVVENYGDGEVVLAAEQLQPKQSVYIANCSDCVIQVRSRAEGGGVEAGGAARRDEMRVTPSPP